MLPNMAVQLIPLTTTAKNQDMPKEGHTEMATSISGTAASATSTTNANENVTVNVSYSSSTNQVSVQKRKCADDANSKHVLPDSGEPFPKIIKISSGTDNIESGISESCNDKEAQLKIGSSTNVMGNKGVNSVETVNKANTQVLPNTSGIESGISQSHSDIESEVNGSCTDGMGNKSVINVVNKATDLVQQNTSDSQPYEVIGKHKTTSNNVTLTFLDKSARKHSVVFEKPVLVSKKRVDTSKLIQIPKNMRIIVTPKVDSNQGNSQQTSIEVKSSEAPKTLSAVSEDSKHTSSKSIISVNFSPEDNPPLVRELTHIDLPEENAGKNVQQDKASSEPDVTTAHSPVTNQSLMREVTKGEPKEKTGEIIQENAPEEAPDGIERDLSQSSLAVVAMRDEKKTVELRSVTPVIHMEYEVENGREDILTSATVKEEMDIPQEESVLEVLEKDSAIKKT